MRLKPNNPILRYSNTPFRPCRNVILRRKPKDLAFVTYGSVEILHFVRLCENLRLQSQYAFYLSIVSKNRVH
jgi:hypothetical protein